MKKGLSAEVVWWDNDVIQLRICCSDGRFSGQTELYVSHDIFGRIADSLEGFPSSSSDLRNLELGTFDPKCAGGGIFLKFHCIDSVGHPVIDIKLRNENPLFNEFESVVLRIPIEAAGVDAFFAQVRNFVLKDRPQIFLPMAI